MEMNTADKDADKKTTKNGGNATKNYYGLLNSQLSYNRKRGLQQIRAKGSSTESSSETSESDGEDPLPKYLRDRRKIENGNIPSKTNQQVDLGLQKHILRSLINLKPNLESNRSEPRNIIAVPPNRNNQTITSIIPYSKSLAKPSASKVETTTNDPISSEKRNSRYLQYTPEKQNLANQEQKCFMLSKPRFQYSTSDRSESEPQLKHNLPLLQNFIFPAPHTDIVSRVKNNSHYLKPKNKDETDYITVTPPAIKSAFAARPIPKTVSISSTIEISSDCDSDEFDPIVRKPLRKKIKLSEEFNNVSITGGDLMFYAQKAPKINLPMKTKQDQEMDIEIIEIE